MTLSLLLSGLLLAAAPENAVPADQQPFECTSCEAWNATVEPRKLAANSWYVGTRGLGAALIVDPEGLVLIDGGLPQSAERILDNVRKAGFDPADIRWILNSHAHFDHAGGIAALARITGAKVAVGREGVIALTGSPPYHPDDPQAAFGSLTLFPRVNDIRPVDDGDRITVGRTTITAVASPGHAPGGMSWSWRSCDASGECQSVVYLDSLNAVSADDYRFSDHPATVAALRDSIRRVSVLPCDVATAAHPDQLPQAANGESACARYAAAAGQRLQQRLVEESKSSASP